MAHRRTRVQFRRRKEGKTNYRARLKMLKSGKPRAVIRKTLNNTIVQIVEYHDKGDKILTGTVSSELKKYGWNSSCSNTSAAYLTAFLAGKKAQKLGVNEAVLDIGINIPSKGCKMFAALKGLVDSGMHIPHNDEIIPSEDRLKGEHINNELPGMFDEVKSKILSGEK